MNRYPYSLRSEQRRIPHAGGGEPVYEQQYIQILTAGADATGSGGVDVTGGTNESYFEMAISRVRQPL